MADDDGPGRAVSLAQQPAMDLFDGACGRAGGVVVAVLAAAVPPREGPADRLLNELARSLRLPDEIHPKTPRRWLRARPPSALPCIPRQP